MVSQKRTMKFLFVCPWPRLCSLFATWIILSVTTIVWSSDHNSNHYCSNITITGPDNHTQFEKHRHCHVIEGHLRIQGYKLPPKASLPQLTQVTDYILIERVEKLTSLSELFPCLSVIRGQRLFRGQYALVLRANRNLLEIGPWSLSVIKGAVHVQDNILFCTHENLQWRNITESTYRDKNEFINNRLFCPFVGCEEEGYCERRPKSCSRKIMKRNCHEECLGGCTSQRNASGCIACKKFLLDTERNGTGACVKNCSNRHLLKYMNYQCITYETCQGNINWAVMNKTKSREKENKTPAPESLSAKNDVEECVYDCPENLVRSEISLTGGHKIRRCTPSPECVSTTLTNMNLGKNLRYCEKIDGNLIIRVAGGKNVAKQLEQNLQGIKTIRGYVMVVGASALFSLSFLSNLKHIEGNETFHGDDSRKGYALYILENPHLRELWNWDTHPQDLTIGGGSVYIYFNDKLCPREIEKLRKIAKVNISHDFNGKKSECKIFETILEATPVPQVGSIRLRWLHTFCSVDYRYFLGYQIFYRVAPKNVSLYEGRDACNDKSVWSRKRWTPPDLNGKYGCLQTFLEGLLPNTRYAIYIRSLAVYYIKSAIQSNITYATTYNTRPQKPRRNETIFSESGIHISWITKTKKPKDTSSDLFYEVILHLKEATLDSNKKESCDKSPKKKEEEEEEEKENDDFIAPPSPSADSCNCDDEIEDRYLPLLQERKLQKIATDNEINGKVYYRDKKNPTPRSSAIDSNTTTTKNDSILNTPLDTACERMEALPIDCPSTPVQWDNSSLKFDGLNKPSLWIKQGNVLRKSERTSNPSIDDVWPAEYAERTKPVHLEVEIRSCVGEFKTCPQVGISTPCALCSDYLKTSVYDVKNKAVTNLKVSSRSEEKEEESSPCDQSVQSQSSPKWIPWEKVKDDQEMLLRRKRQEESKAYTNGTTENYSSYEDEEMPLKPHLIISWSVPEDLEQITLSYVIFYQRIDIAKVQSVQVCIPAAEADKFGKEIKLPVTNGSRYWAGVRAQTLAGRGEIVGKCVSMPWNQNTDHLVILVVGGFIFVILLVSVIGYLIHKEKRRPEKKIVNNVNYRVELVPGVEDSVGPLSILNEGINLEIIYEEKLGDGRFGNVYKGKAEQNNKVIPVAVKTIIEDNGNIENPIPREKKNAALLEEAAIMKKNENNFIVKFLGVSVIYQDVKPSLVLVLEYMKDRDLLHFLRKDSILTETQKVEILIQVADGLAYLNDELREIHRDVAARNVLVSRDESRIIAKVGDFGLTSLLKAGYDIYHPHQKRMLSPRWTAPEALKGKGLKTKSDVWSFGVLIFEIITYGQTPYKGYNNDFVSENVPEGNLTLFDQLPKDSSVFLVSQMENCLQMNEESRPTFLSLIADEFLPRTSDEFREWFLDLSYYDSVKFNITSSPGT